MSTYIVSPTKEQETYLRAFLIKNHIHFFKEDDALPDFVKAGIANGREEARNGNTKSTEQVFAKYRDDV
jgi:hypothetical protein